jgi:hypothetical protein
MSSFDTEFDYTGSITFIDSRTDTINVEIDAITTKLSDLAAIDSAFDYLTNPETTSLNHTKGVYDGMVSNLQGLKANIQAVTSLSSGDKTALYTFYNDALSQTNETKQQWMSRMVYNTTALVGEAGNVNGGSLSTAEKGLLAELICQKYPIKGVVYQVQSQF